MKGLSVIRNDGTRGLIVEDENQEKLIIDFDDGTRFVVSSEVLQLQEDGSYYLSVGTADLISDFKNNATEQEYIIPVIAEEISVETERIARSKVRVNKRVETREEVVNASVIHERVKVDRIAINEIIKGEIPKIRQENGILIIPVIEEVIVVQKRLILKEEVHLIKERTKETQPQTVVLRKEIVDIETINIDPENNEIFTEELENH